MIFTIILIAFAVIMFVGGAGVVFKSGEKEGICKYGYMEDENK